MILSQSPHIKEVSIVPPTRWTGSNYHPTGVPNCFLATAGHKCALEFERALQIFLTWIP